MPSSDEAALVDADLDAGDLYARKTFAERFALECILVLFWFSSTLMDFGGTVTSYVDCSLLLTAQKCEVEIFAYLIVHIAGAFRVIPNSSNRRAIHQKLSVGLHEHIGHSIQQLVSVLSFTLLGFYLSGRSKLRRRLLSTGTMAVISCILRILCSLHPDRKCPLNIAVKIATIVAGEEVGRISS